MSALVFERAYERVGLPPAGAAQKKWGRIAKNLLTQRASSVKWILYHRYHQPHQFTFAQNCTPFGLRVSGVFCLLRHSRPHAIACFRAWTKLPLVTASTVWRKLSIASLYLARPVQHIRADPEYNTFRGREKISTTPSRLYSQKRDLSRFYEI